VIVDRHGTPLAVSLTGGNRHDVTQLMPLVPSWLISLVRDFGT
jgi:transposase